MEGFYGRGYFSIGDTLLNWLDKKLRKPFELIFYGERPTQTEAINLLKILSKESPRFIENIVGPSKFKSNFPIHCASGPWSVGNPLGIVDYYTADTYINSTLLALANPAQNEEDWGSVHAVVGRGGHIIILKDPLSTFVWHKATVSTIGPASTSSDSTIAIAYVNGGFLTQTATGFFCGANMYKMKEKVPPQRIINSNVWWDPFESAIIISSIILKRLLATALPSLDISCFVNYGKLQFKHSGMQHPLWPFNAINLLAFNWVNLSNIKSLQYSEFSLRLLKQFEFEVQKYI